MSHPHTFPPPVHVSNESPAGFDLRLTDIPCLDWNQGLVYFCDDEMVDFQLS